jgi:hypothetical protein
MPIAAAIASASPPERCRARVGSRTAALGLSPLERLNPDPAVRRLHHTAVFENNIIRMNYASLFLATVLLALTSAHAGSYFGARKMLRDASVYHDEEHIRSLISREVDAEDRHDYIALRQVIKQLGDAADHAVDLSKRTTP